MDNRNLSLEFHRVWTGVGGINYEAFPSDATRERFQIKECIFHAREKGRPGARSRNTRSQRRRGLATAFMREPYAIFEADNGGVVVYDWRHWNSPLDTASRIIAAIATRTLHMIIYALYRSDQGGFYIYILFFIWIDMLRYVTELLFQREIS